MTHENVIRVRGTITAIAQALGHWGKLGSPASHFLGGSLDIATLAHMTIINTKGGINKYPYHKQIFFITISNKRKWNCDCTIVREVVMPCEGDEGGQEGDKGREEGEDDSENDDDDEGEEVGQEAQPHGEPQEEQEPTP